MNSKSIQISKWKYTHKSLLFKWLQ